MLTIESKIIRWNDGVVATINTDGSLMVSYYHFTGDNAKQVLAAMSHAHRYGTFCPEPPPPIEWEQVRPNLWVAEGWIVVPAHKRTDMWITRELNGNDFGGVETLADAKAYAEKQIREGR